MTLIGESMDLMKSDDCEDGRSKKDDEMVK